MGQTAENQGFRTVWGVSISGLPVVPFEKIESVYPPDTYDMMFAIGYKRMNTVRKSRMEAAIAKGYRIASYIHPSALIQTNDIGIGNLIFENVTIGDKVHIGDGNIFYPVAHIAHDTSIGNYNFFTVSSVVAGNVEIGNCCVFGANSTIKNGICIADSTLVGAGAYISANTEEGSVYVPQRSFKLEGKSSFDFEI